MGSAWALPLAQTGGWADIPAIDFVLCSKYTKQCKIIVQNIGNSSLPAILVEKIFSTLK